MCRLPGNRRTAFAVTNGETGDEAMDMIRGTNFGNWLVLEKWMDPGMFADVKAEDEIWLNRLMDREKLA